MGYGNHFKREAMRRELSDLIRTGKGSSEAAQRLRLPLGRYDRNESYAIQAQNERVRQDRERRKAKTGAVCYLDGRLCSSIRGIEGGIQIQKRKRVLNLVWKGYHILFDPSIQQVYSVEVTDCHNIPENIYYSRYELFSET